MKVAFFQPYLANWRIEFLEFFTEHYAGDGVIIYDGGFAGKNDTKSVSGNMANFKFRKLLSWSPVFTIKGQAYPLYFSPGLLFHLLKDKPDVVITEGEINFINNIFIWFYCLMFGKKYVWWSLGKVRTRKANIVNKLFDPIVNFLLHRASCVMARNTLAKTYYIEQKGFKDERVIVAPNSMNHHKLDDIDQEHIESLVKSKKSRVMLYVGALTDSKRPIDLITALSALHQANNHDISLWFVGAGPELDRLKAEVKKFNLEESVTFFGKVFNGVGDYFSAADFVVVPGLGGLVINHAMLYGKPVISRLADGTELDLIIEGETGYLVDGYEQSELVAAIEKMLNSDIEQMATNCREKVANDWNIDIMFQRVNQCIEFES